jgi:hypothetical protein
VALGQTTDCANSALHPQEKAQCLLLKLINDGSNAEIKAITDSYRADETLEFSGEVAVAFVGGRCPDGPSSIAATKICYYNYVVSTDAYNLVEFRPVAALIESPSEGGGAPRLIRVFSENELK